MRNAAAGHQFAIFPRDQSSFARYAIWIARWLRIRPVDLTRRYACDPRRLYEIWEETRFPGSREQALAELQVRYPQMDLRFDPGPHRRRTRMPHPSQLSLFPAT